MSFATCTSHFCDVMNLCYMDVRDEPEIIGIGDRTIINGIRSFQLRQGTTSLSTNDLAGRHPRQEFMDFWRCRYCIVIFNHHMGQFMGKNLQPRIFY
mgnify:CR=1 FL=1|jgi:hypothetical protein